MLCVILVITGRLSLFLTGTSEGVALIWLPAGVALVTLVFIDRYLWPAGAIGSFITNMTFGLPIATALGIAAGNTLGVVVGVAAVSAGLQEVEATLADGRTVKGALAVQQGQAQGAILLVHEWWGLV